MIILNVMVAICLGITVMGVCLYLKYKYDRKVRKQKAYMEKLGLRYEPKYTLDLEEFEIPREHVELTRKLGKYEKACKLRLLLLFKKKFEYLIQNCSRIYQTDLKLSYKS